MGTIGGYPVLVPLLCLLVLALALVVVLVALVCLNEADALFPGVFGAVQDEVGTCLVSPDSKVEPWTSGSLTWAKASGQRALCAMSSRTL